MAKETTKLQKEVIQITIEELKRLKTLSNINTDVTLVYRNIDPLIHGLITGTIEPKLSDAMANRLGDILYEYVTFLRDLER